jgi:signal transduction histidine kinase
MSSVLDGDSPEDLGEAVLSPALTFPDVPQMELEALLGQLTHSAQQVLTSQGRLRGLLKANAAIVSDLSLPVLLRHITTAARELVNAEYAALGMIGRDGNQEEFVHIGMETDVVSQVGELPQGRGLLRYLVTDPAPLCLCDLSIHPAAVRLPEHHPAMSSFLGVPIKVRQEIYGNLYLANSAHGQFSAEDEQLLTALAATAGVAIANARLHQETLQQRHWLAASTELTQELFANSDEAPLDMVLRYALQGASADSATVAVLSACGHLVVQASAGRNGADVVGTELDTTRSLAGQVIQTGAPTLKIRPLRPSSATSSEISRQPSAIGAPLLTADGTIIGALTVGRNAQEGEFSDVDRDQLATFASHAGKAIELDRARSAREAVRTVQDHDRIAADLHDHVIQELFATGMGLESMSSRLTDPEQQALVEAFVDALDSTVRRIRTTIFQLQRRELRYQSLQLRVMTVLDEERPALGFSAAIEFVGALDLLVSGSLADDVVAVVRETMSNVARHAQATAARISISLLQANLTIDVRDNGAGIGNSGRSSGLSNLRQRAAAHGGILELDVPSGGGTHVRWTAVLA